jgi:predicted secreted protein
MPPIPSTLPAWAVVAMLLVIWLGREGVGAYLKWRAATTAEGMAKTKAEDERALGGYRELIGELKARVTHLEELMVAEAKEHRLIVKELRDEHITCLEGQAESAAKITALQDEVKSQREWRHGIGERAQGIVANVAADKLAADKAAAEKAKEGA